MENILLVEDELLIQKSLQKLIEKRGKNVDVASNGKEAISKILVNDYDRIICDLMLKDTTGFDVIEESKKKFSSTEIQKKFIIITAYSSEQVLNKAREYGCKVIGKPFGDIHETIDILIAEE